MKKHIFTVVVESRPDIPKSMLLQDLHHVLDIAADNSPYIRNVEVKG